VKTRSPNQLVATRFASWKWLSELAAADSHQTASTTPATSACPVIRVRIDVSIGTCQR